MKIINKIKAFFTKENEPVELDLIAAEIKEGRAFLHTKGKVETTYLIRSNDIRILLNEGKSLSAGDIYSITPKKKLGIKSRLSIYTTTSPGAITGCWVNPTMLSPILLIPEAAPHSLPRELIR